LFGTVAVIAANVPLLMWATAVGLIVGSASLWATFAWRRFELTASFRPGRTFAGEPAALRVKMTNGKRLPLPMVRLHVWLPPGLQPAGNGDSYTIRGFDRRLSMPGRSEVVVDLPVTARRRGEYWLEKIEVELADPFALIPLRKVLVPEADLLVMPEPRRAVPLSVRRRLPFGAPAAALRIFEARERFAGVRPYEPGDPLNRIHWKLTGHAGGLQVKLFEPTRTADVLLALDLAAGEPFWDSIYPKIAEETIGWACFIARQAIHGGWRVGMVANTHLRRGRGPLRVPASTSSGQEGPLFAALARMPNEATADLAPVLREAGRRLGANTSVVVISPRPGRWLMEGMDTLRRRGAEVIHLSPLEAALRRER
jgi:uncharacterized protein (DUF58 family)